MGGLTAIGIALPAALGALGVGHDVAAAPLEVALLLAAFVLDLLAIGILVAHRSAIQAFSTGGYRLAEPTARWAMLGSVMIALVLGATVLAGGAH